MRRQPRAVTRIGSKTRSENVARACESMSGSMGRRFALRDSFPVKAARPKAAQIPQRNVAAAMKKYPRSGCSVRGLSLTELGMTGPLGLDSGLEA
jgi:hypothetical protein